MNRNTQVFYFHNYYIKEKLYKKFKIIFFFSMLISFLPFGLLGWQIFNKEFHSSLIGFTLLSAIVFFLIFTLIMYGNLCRARKRRSKNISIHDAKTLGQMFRGYANDMAEEIPDDKDAPAKVGKFAVIASPSKKNKIIQIIIASLFVIVGLILIFSFMTPVGAGRQIATATIVHQEPIINVSHSNDSTTTSSSCKVIMEYDFKGEKAVGEHTFANFSIINNLELDIIIDSETGEFYNTLSHASSLKILGILILVLGVLNFIGILLRINYSIYAPMIMFLISGIVCIFTCCNVSWIEILYSDIIFFIACFLCLSISLFMIFFGTALLYPRNLSEVGEFKGFYEIQKLNNTSSQKSNKNIQENNNANYDTSINNESLNVNNIDNSNTKINNDSVSVSNESKYGNKILDKIDEE